MSIATTLARDLGLLGIYISGDLADVTYYTTKRGNIVAFPKSPPTKPATAAQVRQRARFRYAQRLWTLESAATKKQWEDAMRKASIDMTGQNAYISQSLVPDSATLNTINTRYGLNLVMPPMTPI